MAITQIDHEVSPTDFLSLEHVSSQQNGVDSRAALIVLNQPIADLELLHRLWVNTGYRVCADGGANRLYELFSEEMSSEREQFVRLAA